MTRITGQQSGSGFVPLAAPPAPAESAKPGITVQNVPGGRVTTHRLAG